MLDLDWPGLGRAAGLDIRLAETPEARVSASAIARLLDLAAATSRRRDFALVVTQCFQPSMLGPPVLWAMRQATVGEGVEVYEDRLKSRNNSLLIKIRPIDGLLVFEPLILDPDLRSNSLEVDLAMGVSLRLLRWLLGEGWWPRAAYFNYAKPADASAHRRLFGDARFSAAFSGLAIDERDLARPVRADDPAVMAVIGRHAGVNAKTGGASVAEVMCELIARLLPTGQCGIDEAARRQGVDRRTIHRRLAAEGCSFTDLVERVRRELIAEQISDEARSLTEISAQLGFSSLSTFSRWHRHAFGVAARDVRRHHPVTAN